MTNNETEFYSTADIRKLLEIGNKTCLDLFHRADFPCIKIGKSFEVAKDAFNQYVSAKRVSNKVNK